MSGGSADDATLAIAHWDGTKAILDILINQDTPIPFNPRLAVARFAKICKQQYRCREVHGDAYAGQTFRMDFSDHGVDYVVEKASRTDLYENFEVALNAGQAQLLDLPKLRSELMTIIRRGASLDHMSGRHDDWATSAAGALTLVNPVLGQETPGILEWYRKQAEAAKAEQSAPPTVAQALASEGIGQLGTRRRPTDYVMVRIPTGASNVSISGGGNYVTECDEEGTFCFMAPDDARVLLSPLNPAFGEANLDLVSRLGVKVQPRGVRAVDLIAALEDRSRSPFDRGGLVMDTLRAAGRWPQ